MDNNATIAAWFSRVATELGAEVRTFALNRPRFRGSQGCDACKTRLDGWDRGEASRGWSDGMREAKRPLNIEFEGRESLRDVETAGIEPDGAQKPNRWAPRDFGRIGL